MAESIMRRMPVSADEGAALRDSLVAAMEAAELTGYVVVGAEWCNAFVNFPLGEPGMAYAWTGAWKGRVPRSGVAADVTVAISHVSDAGRLRFQMSPPRPGAGRSHFRLDPPASAKPPARLSFVDGVAEVTLTESRAGECSLTEFVDGDTFLIISARYDERTLRIARATDRAPLIANWVGLLGRPPG